MKKLYALLATLTFLSIGCSKSFDDSALNGRIGDLENRVAKLEELCDRMNTNIMSLQSLVTVLQDNDYITNITPINVNGTAIGYTITFAKNPPITIYHGQNGKDGTEGKEGRTPIIGIQQHTDGNYYWTLDGSWLLDNYGNKVNAKGHNGADGSNGKDGTTPQLKIENGDWYVSYGSGWTRLGPAISQEGVMIESVEQSSDYVNFTFARGGNAASYTIQIPLLSDIDIEFRIDGEEIADLTFDLEETKQIEYRINRSYSPYRKDIVLKAEMLNDDGGYILHISPSSEYRGTITISATEVPTVNRIIVSVYDGSSTSIMRSINVSLKSGFDGHTLYVPQPGIFETTIKRELDKADKPITELKVVGSLAVVDLCALSNYVYIESLDLEDVHLTSDLISGCFCSNLRNLKLPKTLKSIPDLCFSSYCRFQSITIPEGVTYIGIGAFDDCKIAHKLIIPRSVKEIGTGAFERTTIDGGLEIFGDDLTIGDRAFNHSEFNGELKLHQGIVSIGAEAFADCKGLTGDLELPFGLRTIGDYAFHNISCDGKLTIPTGVDIGEHAFSRSKISGHLFIPRNVTFGDYLFSECKGLTSFIFEDEMISDIGEGTFERCSGLSGEPSIPKNVTAIKRYTFNSCTGLTGDLVIPDRVTDVSSVAFWGCTGFSNLVIGQSIQQIDLEQFTTPTIYCRTPTPPNTGVGNNESVYRNKFKHIYVPTGSKEAYLSHPDWAVFKYIIEETDF